MQRIPFTAALLLVCSCSFSGGKANTPPGTDGGSKPDVAGTDSTTPACNPCTDFPATPITDNPTGGTPVPTDAPSRFGPAGSGDASGGPCLIDPEDGTLFPGNWLRPRFRWAAGTGQDVFELRLKTTKQTNELVVYTTATQWTMPKDMWVALCRNSTDTPIEVTVRGMASSGGNPAVGSTSRFTISSVSAAGSIVYWTVGNATTKVTALKGFSVGDESVVGVLGPTDVNAVTPANARTSRCVGCHSSTPDGTFIGFSSSENASNGDPAWTEIRTGNSPSTRPSFISDAGLALLLRESTEMPTFSAGHWTAGDHLAITMYQTPTNGTQSRLIWIDLEATSQTEGTGWGYLVASGDNGFQGNPAWSHSGTTVAYHSAASVNASGLMRSGGGDIYTIPFSKTEGTPAKLAGASDPGYSELYPAWSPGDEMIAFTRVPNSEDGYNNPKAEILVVPAAGGTPVRLRANDPSACVNRTSPGVTNSWPKWAPQSVSGTGGTFYFLVFSSTREGGKPQLFVVPLFKPAGEFGTLGDYPALYLWNQPADEGNHTPAWDMFQIPPVP